MCIVIYSSMMKRSVFLALFSFFCIAAFRLDAESVEFIHIGLEEGLSQSTVLDIVQDDTGYMWFATQGGLNMYDGYSFTVYRHDETDVSSIASDIVRTVRKDLCGRIWAGTYSGISMYDKEHDSFDNYHLTENGRPVEVLEIVPLDEDTLLLDTSSGVRTFDVASGTFQADESFPGLSGQRVTSICRQDSSLYFGTRSGSLFRWNMEDRKMKQVFHEGFGRAKVNFVRFHSPGIAWIGTEGTGLYLVDVEAGRVLRRYSTLSGDLSSDYVRCASYGGDGSLWVGTFKSLCRYDRESDGFTEYFSDPLDNGSISQSSIRTIYHDNQGGMWLGTYFGGVNYWHPLYRRFSTIRNIPYRNSLNDNVVNCVAEGVDGELWIGTNNGGLNRRDRSGHFWHYTARDGLGANDVKALYIDGDYVYIGLHHGGLSRLDRRTGRITNFNRYNSSLNNSNVYVLIPYDANTLLLGMVDGNIYLFDRRADSFTPLKNASDGTIFEDGILISMYMDHKGRIWVGTESGVRTYVLKGDSLVRIDVLPAVSGLDETFVNCIVCSGDSFFWLGTRNGIYGFDENCGSLCHYTVADGLPDNVIYGILQDDEGNLWISTGNGLSMMDYAGGRFRNYSEADGLQSNEFCQYSACRTSDGKMYFGGVNGISFFVPTEIKENTFIPPVSIRSLSVSDSRILPDDGTGILSMDISETEAVRLPAGKSSFTLDYSVPDYISGRHNTFAYRLEGYDESWHHTDSRKVSYSNLPPGEYSFQIKAANKDGIWNEAPTVLGVTIVPVWYRTWWAKMILAMLVLLFVSVVAWYLWARKSMQAKLEMERVDNERIREVNDMKINFYVNMSHQLRTPLTLIMAPLKEAVARESDDKWLMKRLKYVDKGADRLLELVNQLLEYRKDAEVADAAGEVGAAFEGGDAVASGIPSGNKEKVLVVEDNDDIASYLVEGLGAEYDVRRASDGEEALEMLKGFEAGLIVSDVMMPRMDGIKLCRTLKQNIQTSHIPVIMLSAKADLKWQMAGLKVGADDYIPKPFSMDMVMTKIRNIFRTRYSMLEHYSMAQDVTPEKFALNAVDEKFLKKAKQVVEKHIDDTGFTSEIFAEEMNMSRANLHIKMKALTGEATQDFVKKIRFGKACGLIESGKYSIADISVMVGFSSSSYFAAAFRKYVGCLPSDYMSFKDKNDKSYEQ